VLDGAEDGETYVITRAGRRVALIVPAPRANGAAITDCPGQAAGAARCRRCLAAAVVSAGDAATSLDGDPWRD